LSNHQETDSKSQLNSYVKQIKDVRKSLSLRNILLSGSFGLSLLFTFLAVTVFAEQFLYISSFYKSLFLALALFSSGIIGLLLYKNHTIPNFEDFYRSFADDYNLPALKYALDLKLHPRFKSSVFYEISEQKNLSSLSDEDVKKKLLDLKKNHPISKQFQTAWISTILAAILLSGVSMINHDAAGRMFTFWQDYQKPNPYSFVVSPGNVTLEQGKTFQPSITFTGSTRPETVSLAVKTRIEEEFRTLQMSMAGDSANHFKASGISLNNDLEYYVAMDQFKSPIYQADVQLLPRFDELTVDVLPPAYTGLEPSSFIYPFSSIRAYGGSEIQISGSINKPLDSLQLRRALAEDTTQITINDDRSFNISFTLRQSDTLSYYMVDESGLHNKNPFSFRLRQLEDEAPFVSITQPDGELTDPSPDSIAISYEASDDFGLHAASLNFEVKRAFVDQPEQSQIEIPVPQLDAPEEYIWNLTEFTLKPRDEIVYWIEVQDNDRFNGFKTARSQKMVIRVPSIAQNFEEIEERESETQQSLEEVSEKYRQIQKKYDEFKQQLKQGNDDEWEQNRQLEEIKKERKELDKKVEDLNKKFEKLRKDIEKENQLSEQTMEKYEELEKLMKEINDPEIMKMIEEMQKSLDNINKNQLKEAMENLEFNEEKYRERLERTVELFKKLKLNSDLEKMAKTLDKLGEKEEELSKQNNDPAEEAKQQESVKEDLEKVKETLNELEKNAGKNNKKQVEELQKENQQSIDDIQQELQENIENLKKMRGNESKDESKNKNKETSPSDSQDGQQPSPQEMQKMNQQQDQIRQQMQQTAQSMRQAKQKMNQQQQRINLAALENILFGLVNQSDEQEELTLETEVLANRSQAFVEKARTQKNIKEQFVQLSDSLSKLAAEIPQLSNQITEKKLNIERSLDKSVEQLAERNGNQATTAERQVLGGINELSSMLLSLIDQLQNQNSQGGQGGMSAQQMMQQMQNMSGQQEKLNKRLQEMMNDMQGERLSKDQMKRLDQMARQQNQIRKQLEELKKSGAIEPGDKLMSEMERLSEEMENAINDIRGGSMDEPFVKRQQNILSRMLEAEEAFQERGKSEKEREADSAEDTPPSVSPEVTLEELRKLMRQRLQDPNQTSFAEDYQQLIEKYFELLEKQKKVNS